MSGGVDVMAPEGESDGESTLSVLTLTTRIAVSTVTNAGTPRSLGERLGRPLRTDEPCPFLFLARGHIFEPECVEGFFAETGAVDVMGGGISEGSTLAVRVPGGPLERVSALAVRFDDGVRMSAGVSPGVVRLTDLLPVERIEEGFVTSLGGHRPLELLADVTRRRGERSLVLVAIAPRGEGHHRANQCLVRGVTGVHPVKGAVHLGSEIREGDRVAFATPDAHAAFDDFRTMLRSLERGLRGGVPIAGLYVGCGSRGSRLFSRPGADARILRSALEDLPFAGMYSSFEIGPFDGRPRMHVYSGVLSVLYAPS
ncbi:MAG: FIST C-terminal domain-containing protein [Polyangiales bacterium]